MIDSVTTWGILTFILLLPTTILAIRIIVKGAIRDLKNTQVILRVNEETEQLLRHKETTGAIDKSTNTLMLRQLSTDDKIIKVIEMLRRQDERISRIEEKIKNLQ